MSDPRTDDELLRASDPEAFAVFYRRHVDWVLDDLLTGDRRARRHRPDPRPRRPNPRPGPRPLPDPPSRPHLIAPLLSTLVTAHAPPANKAALALSAVTVAFGSIWVAQNAEGRIYRLKPPHSPPGS